MLNMFVSYEMVNATEAFFLKHPNVVKSFSFFFTYSDTPDLAESLSNLTGKDRDGMLKSIEIQMFFIQVQ